MKLHNDLMIIKYCDPTLINIKDSLQRGKVKNRNEKVFKSPPFLFIFAKRRRRLNIWGYPRSSRDKCKHSIAFETPSANIREHTINSFDVKLNCLSCVTYYSFWRFIFCFERIFLLNYARNTWFDLWNMSYFPLSYT